MSLMFVVATVLQLSILLILKQKSEEIIRSLEKDRAATNNTIIEYQERIKRIDKICTILFPFLFILFNGVYWAIML